MHFKSRAICAAVTLLLAAGSSVAQNIEPLRAAAQKAVTTNPEVTARFNAYRSATDAVDVVRGGFLPRVDLNASVGRDNDRITGRIPDESQSLNRSQLGLSLTQLLWDGLGTSKDVDRLTHDRLARYFELLETTEQTVLEAARAHYDVQRFRRLVQLAEDNYVQHRYAFLQIQSRVKAGVGRGVDLEQAGARLALAESNLTTELANLHDVTARYQRVVGELPPAPLPALAMLKPGVPASAGEAVTESLRNSAAISASIEGLRAARQSAGARESAFQPRVEARLRSAAGRNVDGVEDQKRNGSAEIVLNWNLYNGGSDQARVRQQVGLMNQAADLRDRVCRDTRQVAAIAYNDTRKLTEQLVYLERNTLAIEKARDAYRQQFDIGQRSLLDLLNSENELYTAKRSYANAEYDLGIAYARTQAAVNRLGVQLGLTRGEGAPEAPAETEQWAIGEDGPTRCPEVAIEMETIDIDALNKRAAGLSPITPATPAVSSVPLATPVASAAPPLPGSPADTTPAGLTVRRLNDWAAAWEAKDVARYMSFYSPGFSSTLGNTNAWKAKRRALVSKKGPITVKVDEIVTNTLAADRVETSFKQTYRSADFNDMGVKTLTWQRISGQWFIVQESNR